MLRNVMIGCGVVVLALGSWAYAQPVEYRPVVYRFHCIGYPGAMTRGTVHLRIQTTKKMITVDRSCDSSKAVEIQWPPLFDVDGDIVSLDAEVVASTVNKPGTPAHSAFVPCRMHTENKFLSLVCIANPNEDTAPGRVDFEVSISAMEQ